MVRSLIKNVFPVSWFLWFTGTFYYLGLEQCSEMNIVCWDIAQNRKDLVEQQINLQQAVSVRRCNFLYCKLAKLLPPPHSARVWLVLQKNSVSAGGLQQLVCDSSKALVWNRSCSALPGRLQVSPSGSALRAAHALGTRASQPTAIQMLSFQNTHQLPISLAVSFSA